MIIPRRTFISPDIRGAAWRWALPALIAAVCGVVAVTTAAADPPADSAASGPARKILHLLGRIGYGARPGDIERVERIGIERYIDEQLHPELIDDAAADAKLSGFEIIRMTIPQLYERYPQPASVTRKLSRMARSAAGADSVAGSSVSREEIEAYYAANNLGRPAEILQALQGQKIVRAVYSNRQLQETMTDFWLNHFNIFCGKGEDKWLTVDFEMQVIRMHTLGKFQDLLMATAKSPAMLFYLDNVLSSAPRPAPAAGKSGAVSAAKGAGKRAPGINENYAREIMELHTLGVGAGYTQKDVQEVARCFTGWTIDRSGEGDLFVFRPRMHDRGEKSVLGVTIPAGGGIEDGEKVIEILAHHPGTARFIAAKLARRFVSDDPPEALVERIASVYIATDGDISAMLRAILTSDEFNAPAAYRAKIKSPFELAISAIRSLDGVTDGSARLVRMIAVMGQPLYMYQPPTGYPDRAEQWVNTGALVERLNFALALAGNRIPGTKVDLTALASELDGRSDDQLADHAFALLLGGDVSARNRSIVMSGMADTAVMAAAGRAGKGRQGLRVARVFGLVLGSPEFQRR